MGSWVRPFVLGLLLTAAIPATAVLAADSAEQVLLDKANYWRLKDRPDLATQALNQLLYINPNSGPTRSYQLGMLDVQQGKPADARCSRGCKRPRPTARTSPISKTRSARARSGRASSTRLASWRKSGQLDRGDPEMFQQTFRGPPPPSFGVEYYTTLAGTPGGWEQAKEGLEQLAQSSPNDKSVAACAGTGAGQPRDHPPRRGSRC